MTDGTPRLVVIGLGKLGSPMAACFAAKGFDVVGVDVNQDFVAAINDGRAPVFEPQLQEMIDRADGRLRATTDTAAAVASSDVVFMIVPTPSDETGGFSLRYVLEACDTVGQALRDRDDFPLVVLTSTVMPGATESDVRRALEEASGKRAGSEFGLCYSPEFIALGSVVNDFLNPDFLLIGESDERSGEILERIYAQATDNNAPAARMSFVNAELAKISVNTYVTTKITFANMLARICEQLPGADVDVVADALGLDSRIGRRYLTGAIAYGGPCFPRDNVALGSLARALGVPAILAEATDRANREETQRLADLVESYAGADESIAVLGLSYKPNTNVVEESPGLQLVHELASRGHEVIAHDPAASDSARRVSQGLEIQFLDSAADAIARASVVAVTTAWDDYLSLPRRVWEADGRRLVVVDCWRALDRAALGDDVVYVPLGSVAPDRIPVT